MAVLLFECIHCMALACLAVHDSKYMLNWPTFCQLLSASVIYTTMLYGDRSYSVCSSSVLNGLLMQMIVDDFPVLIVGCFMMSYAQLQAQHVCGCLIVHCVNLIYD